MKGVLFNIVEDVVTSEFGPDVWDDLLGAAGLDGVYTSLGNYDDAEFEAIVVAASEALTLPRSEVLRFAGRRAFPLLVARYPDDPAEYGSSRELLAHLDEVIHPQVLTLYPGASPPRFDMAERSEGEAVLVYRSGRRLCHLAEGLIAGAADAYGETVEVDQSQCVLEGADDCHLVVRHRGG